MSRQPNTAAAKDRVYIYAAHAANAIALHAQTTPNGVRSPSYSACMLMLSKLLGREFTKQLWVAQFPIQAFYYRCARGTELVDEHVVPLSVVIRHLLAHAEFFKDSAKLLEFLCKNLTLAWIPTTLDNRLRLKYRSTMPVGNVWYADTNDSLLKNDALWARYTSLEEPIAPPHRPDTAFRSIPRDLPYVVKAWISDHRIKFSGED